MLEGLTRFRLAPVVTARGWSTEQKRAYVIADNKIAANAGWEKALLASELEALNATGFNMDLLGFGRGELRKILGAGGLTHPDAAPPVQPIGYSRPGDVWELGPHRVMCGDATRRADVDRLMAGGLADMVWTDPPYNVAVDGKAGTILNDDMGDPEFRAFLAAVYRRYHEAMRPGAVIYVAHAESERANFTTTFLAAGFKLSQVRIWVKQSATLTRQDFNWQHEPIIYGWKEGAGHYFSGDFTKTSVLEGDVDLRKISRKEAVALLERLLPALRGTVVRVDRPTRSDLHPTMKPVALVEEMLECSSREGEAVLDLFGGSGSTLIAAHVLGRRARLMELDPKFVDVIVQRWQEFTGEEARLEGADQATFNAVLAHRRAAGLEVDDAAWA